MKTRQDNDVNDHTSVTYVENKIEFSWLIRPGAINDENQIRQWRDQLYRYSQH